MPYQVFKLYFWYKYRFENARKLAILGKLGPNNIHILFVIFMFIFCDCPFDSIEEWEFSKKIAKVITLWQKYNLAERRSIKMGIVAIRYYNVWFYLYLQSKSDVVKFLYLSKHIEAGDSFRMIDIHRWCTMQKIRYRTKFVYRKDFPVKANFWNFYSYIRSKVENSISKMIS